MKRTTHAAAQQRSLGWARALGPAGHVNARRLNKVAREIKMSAILERIDHA
jgi:hypothetical protein